MRNKKFAEELDALQAKQNNGRGIRCVQTIVLYLRQNDYDSAKQVASIDGDKIRQYPEVESKIRDIFGCRLHGFKNCPHDLCKDGPEA
jgi:hypothetical protein